MTLKRQSTGTTGHPRPKVVRMLHNSRQERRIRTLWQLKKSTQKILVGYFDESISDNSELAIVYRRAPSPARGVVRDYYARNNSLAVA